MTGIQKKSKLQRTLQYHYEHMFPIIFSLETIPIVLIGEIHFLGVITKRFNPPRIIHG